MYILTSQFTYGIWIGTFEDRHTIWSSYSYLSSVNSSSLGLLWSKAWLQLVAQPVSLTSVSATNTTLSHHITISSLSHLDHKLNSLPKIWQYYPILTSTLSSPPRKRGDSFSTWFASHTISPLSQPRMAARILAACASWYLISISIKSPPVQSPSSSSPSPSNAVPFPKINK